MGRPASSLLDLLTALCLGETLSHKASQGKRGLPLALAGFSVRGVNHRQGGTGPWLRMSWCFLPGRETSPAIRGSSPPLLDVNSPSNEWVSFSVWEDTICHQSIGPVILTLTPPVWEEASGLTRRPWVRGTQPMGFLATRGVSGDRCFL